MEGVALRLEDIKTCLLNVKERNRLKLQGPFLLLRSEPVELYEKNHYVTFCKDWFLQVAVCCLMNADVEWG